MSIRHFNYARSDVKCASASEKLVLLLLADHANAQGVCWPSVGLLADEACLSKRQVQRALARLIATGTVSSSRRSDARRKSALYTIPIVGKVYGSDDARVTPGVTPVSPQGRRPCHPNRQEPPLNQTVTSSDTVTPGPRKLGAITRSRRNGTGFTANVRADDLSTLPGLSHIHRQLVDAHKIQPGEDGLVETVMHAMYARRKHAEGNVADLVGYFVTLVCAARSRNHLTPRLEHDARQWITESESMARERTKPQEVPYSMQGSQRTLHALAEPQGTLLQA